MLCRSVPRPALRGAVGMTLAVVLLGLGACDAGTSDDGATQTTRSVAVPSGQGAPERQGGPNTGAEVATATSPPRDTPPTSPGPTGSDDTATDPGHDAASATLSGSRSPLNKVRETFAQEAAEHVYDHPDVFAGVGWTGENSWHFTIQVAENHLDAPEVAWVRERVPDDQLHMVHFTAVAHSSSDLQRVKDLLGPRMEDQEIIGLGTDFWRNAVQVIATPEDIAAGGGHDAFLSDLKAGLPGDLPADLRDAVLLSEGEMPTVGAAHGP